MNVFNTEYHYNNISRKISNCFHYSFTDLFNQSSVQKSESHMSYFLLQLITTRVKEIFFTKMSKKYDQYFY